MAADGGAHMSGLAIASLLTLFFVPAGYFLLFRFDSSPVPRSPWRQCSEGHNRSGLIDFFLQMAHGLIEGDMAALSKAGRRVPRAGSELDPLDTIRNRGRARHGSNA